VTLREEQRAGMFGKRVLRRIFGSKRDEISRRKLLNEELQNFYFSPNKI
jgi:hypothetical protein